MKRLIVIGNTIPPRYPLLLAWVRGRTTRRFPKFQIEERICSPLLPMASRTDAASATSP